MIVLTVVTALRPERVGLRPSKGGSAGEGVHSSAGKCKTSKPCSLAYEQRGCYGEISQFKIVSSGFGRRPPVTGRVV